MAGRGSLRLSSAPPEIRTYRLAPDLFPALMRRRVALRVGWLAVLLPAVAFYFGSPGTDAGDAAVFDVRYVTLPLTLVIVGVALGLGVRKGVREGRVEWDTYSLTMSDNVMRRQVARLPPMEILRPEVTRIQETQGAGLTVRTADRHRFVFVPEQLVGYEEVRAHLARWRDIIPAGRTRARLVAIGWTTLFLGSYFGSFALRDLKWAMLAGVLLVLCCVVTIREALDSKIIYNQRKAMLIGGMGFVMLAPVARLVFQLASGQNPGWLP